MDQDLTKQIKKRIFDEGAPLCGVAPVDRFDKYAPGGHRPAKITPDAKSVITFAVRQLDTTVENMPHTRYVYSKHHHILNDMIDRIALSISYFLENHGYKAFPIVSEGFFMVHSDIPIWCHRHSAVEAGLGSIGLSAILITPQYGPRVRLGSIITNAPLEPSPRFEENLCEKYQKGDGVEKCKLACIANCPKSAIMKTFDKRFLLDGLDRPKCRGTYGGPKLSESSGPRDSIGMIEGYETPFVAHLWNFVCGMCVHSCPVRSKTPPYPSKRYL